MIPGHLPQAWKKPRGVPIPDTQFSFGGEEDDGGDEAILSLRIQSTDDVTEMDDVLLTQNIFTSEILILYANYFNDAKSLNLSRIKVSKVGL